VCRRLWPAGVDTVTRIEFEWSPGRRDSRYLDNGTAADIAVFHSTPSGGSGVIFIETKYTKDMQASSYALKPRYHEVAASSRASLADAQPRVESGWLQQVWLDHLLLLVTREVHALDSGLFVVTYPEVNTSCRAAVEAYARVLDPAAASSFEASTLEEIVGLMEGATDAEWVRTFRRRYLDPVDAPRAGSLLPTSPSGASAPDE